MLVYVKVDLAVNYFFFFFFFVLVVSHVIIFHPSLNVRDHFDTISKG